MEKIRAVVLGGSLLLARAVAAQPQLPPEVGEPLAEARQTVRSTLEWLARGIDRWFGEEPLGESSKVTDGVVSVGALARQGQSLDTHLRLNARVRLPHLERRAYLFLGRDNQREEITDKPDALSRQQRLLPEVREQTSLLAGLAVAVDKAELRVGVRGGLKPYAQARWRDSWDIDAVHRADLRQTFFVTVDDHLGSTTAFSIERGFTPTLAARWLSAATITQVSRKFEWSSALGVYRSLSGQRRLSAESIVSGGQAPGVGISDVGLQLRWEQPIHRDWVLGEVQIGHFWPRADAGSDAIRGWAAGVNVKMLF